MKVVHINNHSKILGGSEVVMLGEVEALRASKVETFMITSGKATVRAKDHLIVREPYFKYSIFNVRVFIEVVTWLFGKNIDIAHLHIYYGKLSNSILLALKLHGIILVQSVHEYRRLCPNYKMLDNDGNICELCPKSSIWSVVKKKCINESTVASLYVLIEVYIRDKFFHPKKFIDSFIYVSNFIKNKHHYYQGRDDNNVLWNFTSGEDSSGDIEAKDYDFIYVGRLSKEKGLSEFLALIEGYERVLLVGEGELRKKLECEYNSVDNITFSGYVNNEEVKELVRKAKFLVVPSLWYENNPVIIMEAYSVGVPVIGSRIGGIPEIVEDGVTGYLVDFSDTIEARRILKSALSEDFDQYSELSKNAKNFYVTNFRLQDHVKKLTDIYKKLLKNKITRL